MAAYPLVPKNEVGFRIQTTAANTDEEIDELIRVLGHTAGPLPAAGRATVSSARPPGLRSETSTATGYT